MDTIGMFVPITKVDEEKRLVYGIATAEVVDKAGEICDYQTTKPYYEKWSSEFAKATGGKSLGNIRVMHGKTVAGKAVNLEFDDDNKRIMLCAKITDDNEWEKVKDGTYTGFSQGGGYVKRWKDPDNAEVTRYTARPSEVSLVDSPCLQIARFEYVKADGSIELRKFHIGEDLESLLKADILTAAEGASILDTTSPASWALYVEPICKVLLDDIDNVLTKYSDDQSRDERGRFTASLAGQVAGGLTGAAIGRSVGQIVGSVAGGAAGASAGTVTTANPLGSLAGGVVGSEVGSTVGGAVGAVVGGYVGAKLGGDVLGSEEEVPKKKDKAKKVEDFLHTLPHFLPIEKGFWDDAMHPRDAAGRFASGAMSAMPNILGWAAKASLTGVASVTMKASKSEMAVSVVKAVIGYAIKTAVAEAISHSAVSGLKWAGVTVSDSTAAMISTIVGVATHAVKSDVKSDGQIVMDAAAKDLPKMINLVCDTFKEGIINAADMNETTRKRMLSEIETNREQYLKNVARLKKSHEDNNMIDKTFSNEEVVAKATELATAAGDANTWPSHIDAAREALTKSEAGSNAPSVGADASGEPKTADTSAEDDVAKSDGDIDPLDVAQVWKAKDGSTFLKKSDAVQHNIDLVKSPVTDSLNKAIAKLNQAIEPDKKAETPTRKSFVTDDMKKYLGEEAYDASRAIQALNYLFELMRSELGESEEAPEQIAALQDAITRLKAFIVLEIQEDNTAKKFETWLDKTTEMSKAEGKTSDLDNPELQSLFKKFTDIGFTITDPAMEKAVAERDALKKSSEVVLDRVETILKKMEEQDKVIARLSNTAMPPPTVRIVEKAHDDKTEATNLQKFTELTPQEQAFAVIKASQLVQRQ